jgi:hypothetical protein
MAEHLAILTIMSEAWKALCTDEARTFVSRADFCRKALIAEPLRVMFPYPNQVGRG